MTMIGEHESGARGPMSSRSAITYIIGTFPLLTTTFIDREIAALRARDIELNVIAMRRPDPATPLSIDQKRFLDETTYVIPIRWRTLILSHLRFAFDRPARFFGTLIYLLTRHHPDLKARLKTVLHFAEGVYTAGLLVGTKCDEIHAHFADRAATVALVAGRLLDKPYSLSIHAGADIFVEPILLREKVLGARRVVTCTSHNVSHIVSVAGDDVRSKLSHVRHGLELSLYEPGFPEKVDPPTILSVGQLAERKGFADLVLACGHLAAGGYAFRCRILGDGPQRERLERLIVQLSLENVVELGGAVAHEEVIASYRQAAMFVLPCFRTKNGDVDGIPNVLAEAMASRLPVISSRLPAITELVEDGRNGLLVPPADVPALTRSIRTLIERPALRRRLADEGLKTVHEVFNLTTNIDRFAETMWPEWTHDEDDATYGGKIAAG